MEKRLDAVVAGVMLLVAASFAIFIDRLVAPPKMLLGRSLTAIEPSLFPLVTIAAMIGLCALFLFTAYRRPHRGSEAGEEEVQERADWFRVSAFFGILIFYALIFKPIGFLISTLLSVLAGARSVLQILALSSLCPIALYLASTRLLRVSLPELSSIEFAFAALFGN
jgi:putative tricarboxylic transport membrane protein